MVRFIGALILVLSIISGRQLFNDYVLYPYVNYHTIKLYGQDGGHGSAFFYRKNGTTYIVTNEHVCKDNSVMMYHHDGNKFLTSALHSDVLKDVCILKAPQNQGGLMFTNKDAHQMDVFNISYPGSYMEYLAKGNLMTQNEITIPYPLFKITSDRLFEKCKLVSSTKQNVMVMKYIDGYFCVQNQGHLIRSSIIIHRGSSGSPVVDYYGRVVGLIEGANFTNGHAFIVLIKHVDDLIKEYEGMKK